MSECEFCGQEVENPSHVVVNGRISNKSMRIRALSKIQANFPGYFDVSAYRHVHRHGLGCLETRWATRDDVLRPGSLAAQSILLIWDAQEERFWGEVLENE